MNGQVMSIKGFTKDYSFRIPLKRAFRKCISDILHVLVRIEGFDNNGRILIYHSVSKRPSSRLSVSVESFEDQMAYLKREHYNVISLKELAVSLMEKKPMPPRSVAITFDDGYEDNYLFAYPVLRRYDFPATIFLITDYINENRIFKWQGKNIQHQFLSWKQIHEMRRDGISFGSHTCTHPLLSQISLDQAVKEIAKSKHAIERILGETADFFCYPKGDFCPTCKQIVRKTGYLGACSILPGANDSDADLFALRRTEISGDDTMLDFRKKLMGAFDSMHIVVQRAVKLERLIRDLGREEPGR